MKSILKKSTFKWVLAFFVVCSLFWILVFADVNNIFTGFFDSWGSDKHNYELSAETWDSVLQELDQLKAELENTLSKPSMAVPTWAIAAFDWKSWCPEGWSIYNKANWKVLVWVSNVNQAMMSGGSSTATLNVQNLPAHTHYFKDTMFSEAFLEAYRNNFMRGEYTNDYWNRNTYKLFSAWVRDIPWKYPAWWSYQEAQWVIFGQEADVDYDNYPIYWVRLTSSEVCSTEFWNKVNTYWDNLNWNLTISSDKVEWSFLNFKWTALSSKVKDYCYWTSKGKSLQQPFSVLDPYLTVVYCIKDWGDQNAWQNTQPQTDVKCNYNGTLYEVGATVNWVYDILELNCVTPSTTCTPKSATCGSNWKWKINWAPVPKIFSSCSVVSVNPNHYTAESCNCGWSDYWLVAYNNGTACKYVYKCNSCWGGGCFLAGTKVLTDKWTKNIELLKAWDLVLSYNEETASNEYKKVVRPIIHENISEDLYELSINWDLLKATSSHPFYVLWNINDNKSTNLVLKLANELVIWDILLMSDWRTVSIDWISHYPYSGTVHNIEVEDNHNYYVGEWYLVHNKVAPAELYEWINPYD